MDSNKIKNLAFGARDALRAEVAARIDSVLEPGSPERLDLPEKVKSFEATIDDKGMDAVVEATAYTWFNRLCALRFMDAKGYTPVPVVTPRPGATQPAILADAAEGVFDPDFGFSRLVRDRVQSVLAGGSGSGANRTEAAYGELLVAVCDHYAQAMPYLFGEAAASSLVMPQGLLAEGSILRRIVEDMDDEECETVEVLGWLYQFYVAERKAEFNGSDRKATADDIAPATQLFTPDWIVKYLVENSLGRLWMLNNPGSALANKMDYYIAPEGEIEDFIKVYSPEELTLCDPACGSGHILVYAFDLLFEIYQEEGYFPEDVPALILRNNLFGMEIDGRAAEIAKFALEMKAREKDPDFFEKHIDANVTVLEPVAFEPGALAGAGPIAGATELLDAFEHMTEVGSLYVPAPGDMAAVDNAIASFSGDDLLGAGVLRKLRTMKNVIEALSRRVDCVVANPPYMGIGNLNDYYSDWVKERYPKYKDDICYCFCRRALDTASAYSAVIMKQGWMFDSRPKSMRKELLENTSIYTLIHLGTGAFDAISGEKVSTMAFVSSSKRHEQGVTVFIDLTSYASESVMSSRYLDIINDQCAGRYQLDVSHFMGLKGFPMAYWCPDGLLSAASHGFDFSAFAESRHGLVTGDKDSFVHLWWEVAQANSSYDSKRIAKWVAYDKGGAARRWYGNRSFVVNWENDGAEIKACEKDGKIVSSNYNPGFEFRSHITWSDVRSNGGYYTARFTPKGALFDTAGPSLFPFHSDKAMMLLAFLNSVISQQYLDLYNQGLHYTTGSIDVLPLNRELMADVNQQNTISEMSTSCVEITRTDWDSFENSWDFEWHPLAPSARERAEQLSYGMNSNARAASVSLISERFARWSADCDDRFNELKSNEEELNRVFARIYGMEDEVPIEVPDDKVSVRRADLVRDVKSLISYGVGCIVGRYSTFAPGLILADAQQTVDDFKAKVPNAGFLPDEDAILPMLDGEWFGDDIVAQFRKWLEVTYGAETLDENIRFIEDALGKDLRKYFVKDFYKDHCATYQVTGSGKRPIYWMFASPKGSFQVLVYMHRYTRSTVGQILTKYLREYIEKINAKIGQLDQSDRAADNRQADKYRAVVHELTDWERDVIYPLANERVDIDLDDGVRKNYNKFPRALAKVAGLSEWK